tara:strand:+ start:229 stop:657 length:429 start_codon:yes stop_codon:yes gene_type:complete
MAKYYAGQDGSVEFGTSSANVAPVAKVVQWSLTANTDALEVTTLGQDVRAFTTGVRSASGTMTVLYYEDAPVKLLNQVNQDTSEETGDSTISSLARLKLKFDTKFLEFDAVLTSAELSCVVGEVMRVNVNFTMSGDFASKLL